MTHASLFYACIVWIALISVVAHCSAFPGLSFGSMGASCKTLHVLANLEVFISKCGMSCSFCPTGSARIKHAPSILADPCANWPGEQRADIGSNRDISPHVNSETALPLSGTNRPLDSSAACSIAIYELPEGGHNWIRLWRAENTHLLMAWWRPTSTPPRPCEIQR